MSEPTTRSILFRPALVRRIIAGQKTQTRRIIQPLPHWLTDGFMHRDPPMKFGRHVGEWVPIVADYELGEYPVEIPRRCPFGKVGDLLTVRENWRPSLREHGDRGWANVVEYDVDLPPSRQHWRAFPEEYDHAFKAIGDLSYRVRPSIHMPNWASRLTLEIARVRVERLNDITAEDVYAEGIGEFVSSNFDVAQEMFARVWNVINEPRGFPWTTDPWLWVIEFRIHTLHELEVDDVR